MKIVLIKAIIFDLDDTLYNYSQLNKEGIEKIAEFICEKFEITREKFYEAFNLAKKSVKEELTEKVASSHNRMLYCQKILENLDKNPFSYALEMYEIYWNHILENMKLNDNVILLFEFCKKKNIKIGICTDLTVHIQHRKIRQLEIDKYIDAIVTSEEAGTEKPDFKIYEKILKKLDVSPEEVLFIGDNYKKDVKGPSNFGMRSLWYSKNKDTGYMSITDFKKVMEIINE